MYFKLHSPLPSDIAVQATAPVSRTPVWMVATSDAPPPLPRRFIGAAIVPLLTSLRVLPFPPGQVSLLLARRRTHGAATVGRPLFAQAAGPLRSGQQSQRRRRWKTARSTAARSRWAALTAPVSMRQAHMAPVARW